MKWYPSALQKYSDFEGRASRKEYWTLVLFNVFILILAKLLDRGLGAITHNGVGDLVYYLCIAVLFLPGIAVNVRRLHDVNKSGWFMFLNLVPIIGFIWILVLTCLDGTRGENKYGSDPKLRNT